ncbi:nuclear transport factor 2 family protein [Hydrogenophaga sp. OTU3427]|uniref:nuclear transport factor 2 family protein n=1 Tax=Hydrogenophaga sp. OTU3427 TaxID=3043856 RepID=UPI00313F3760
MNTTDINTLADRFFQAIEAKDLAGLRACYHDDTTVWHNFDDHAQSVDDNVALLGRLCRFATSLRYTEVERITYDGGFVQRHVLVVQVGDRSVRIPACLVAQTLAGRIHRIFEYLDSAHRTALYAGAGS